MFSKWTNEDSPLAEQLWGNGKVTKYICARGVFTKHEIRARLNLEIENDANFGVQYWPLFSKSGSFIGCCGLRPHDENEYELGFHLLPEFWHQGYATEAAKAVMRYAFQELGAKKLFAGHNPKNIASKNTLTALGFVYTHDEFYPPTGLMHPSYEYIYRNENKDCKMKASELMKKYAMELHIENGTYVEKHYPSDKPGRPDSGSIFYYVAPGETTQFHRIDCDEYWIHNAGSDIEIWSFSPDGKLNKFVLGTSASAEPLVFLKRGEIFASRLSETNQDGAFLTCITVPRFTYDGFEMFDKETMIELYPEAAEFWD